MLARHRQSLILEDIRRAGSARVSDLTQRLGVSDMTIRRDLEALARAGLIEKVHGGAVLPGSPSSHEPGFEAKSVLEKPQKEAIARAAAELVTPGHRDRAVRGDHHVRPGPAAAGRARADDRDQFGPGGEHLRDAAGRRPVRRHPPGRAHRRGPHPLGRAGRPDRGHRDPLPARGPALPGLPRHRPGRPGSPRPTSRRRRPTGPSCRPPGGSRSSPTTRSGASSG